MKKTYEGLEMEVIRFSTEDIITTSEAKTTDNTPVQTPVQTGTSTQTSNPTVPDGYTATGDTFTDMYGTTYPVYIKDGDPSQLYIYNGAKMVALTMPKS